MLKWKKMPQIGCGLDLPTQTADRPFSPVAAQCQINWGNGVSNGDTMNWYYYRLSIIRSAERYQT